MAMFHGTEDAKWVDGDPQKNRFDPILGRINQNLMGSPNCEVLAGGLFRALRDIKMGEELFIVYAKDYNWDCIKIPAYADLLSELARDSPRMWKFLPKNWAEAKVGRDQISRWLRKLIDGNLDGSATSMHSSSGTEPLNAPMALVR
jgi:hypothetical protein